MILSRQKLRNEIGRNPIAAGMLTEQMNDKGKLLHNLEDQLYQLTGIHAESHVSNYHPSQNCWSCMVTADILCTAHTRTKAVDWCVMILHPPEGASSLESQEKEENSTFGLGCTANCWNGCQSSFSSVPPILSLENFCSVLEILQTDNFE